MDSIAVLHTQLFQENIKDSDLYFNTLEMHLKSNRQFIEKPHRHNSYVAVLFTKGTGLHEIDFQNYEVSAGSLFFMVPGQIHSWQLSDDSEGFIFFISPEYYDLHFVNLKLKNYPFFASPYVSRKITVNDHDINQLTELLRAVEYENMADEFMKNASIIALLTLMFVYATRHYTDQATLTTDSKLSYFKHYYDFENLIENHFKRVKSVSKYADILGITLKHLNRVTQSVVNKTASALLTDRIILEAKRMLIFMDESVVDIAFGLGYEDYSYFTRVFSKKAGLSPTQFRQKYKS